VDEALASLSDSIDRGFAASEDLLQDPDPALRGDPRFSALLARTKSNEERRR
jgi:hypothetical protein